MVPSVLVLTLATLIGASQAAGLSKCPSTETQVTTPDGSIYAVCKKTDYQGETTSLNTQVPTETACAVLCNQKSGCTQAVYDQSASVCHLKGPASNLNWVTSQQYTTIRFVAKPAIGSKVTSCPTIEQSVTTNGVTFGICANIDYQGETKTAIPQITSAQACAAECAKLPACTNAVYSASSSQCFIKNPNGAQLRWTYDLSYTSVRVVSAPQQGSTLSSCPAGASSSIRSSTRVPFSACTNGDWHADSIDILGGVASVQACADICGPRMDCSFASYDAPSKACHIKPTNPAPVFVFNRGFTALKRGNSPRRV